MKNIKLKKIFLFGVVSLLTACSSGGVYSNVACGVHAPCERSSVKEERINLAADALFQFDKYTKNDLLPMGRQQLDDLAHKLANHYIEIKNITLIGHTDRLGSVAYNNALGLNRAKTVRAYLRARGVNVNILAKTAGESQPVTDGCRGVRPQVKLRACLQPDRRVVVRVLGVKKTKVQQCNRGEHIVSPAPVTPVSVKASPVKTAPMKPAPVKAIQPKVNQVKERLVDDAQMSVNQMPLPMVQKPQIQDRLGNVNLTSD